MGGGPTSKKGPVGPCVLSDARPQSINVISERRMCVSERAFVHRLTRHE